MSSVIPAAGLRVLGYGRALQFIAAAALLSMTVGFGAGWKVHSWNVAKETLKAERSYERDASAERSRQHEIAARNVATEQQIHDAYREGRDALAREITEHPDRWACDIGDSGLRLWNSWNQGRGVLDPGSGAGGADRADTAGEVGRDERPGGQPP